MIEVVAAVVAFIVISGLVFTALWPQAKVQAKAMDDPNVYRKYHWQDEIIPEDAARSIKLLNSWLFMSIVIPAASWVMFYLLYKFGFLSDARKAVTNFFWLPVIIFSAVMLLGVIALAITESSSGIKLSGIPFWKKLQIFKGLRSIWKPFVAAVLAGTFAARLALGWVFMGGVIYFSVMK